MSCENSQILNSQEHAKILQAGSRSKVDLKRSAVADEQLLSKQAVFWLVATNCPYA
jgi:hypothetical protein